MRLRLARCGQKIPSPSCRDVSADHPPLPTLGRPARRFHCGHGRREWPCWLLRASPRSAPNACAPRIRGRDPSSGPRRRSDEHEHGQYERANNAAYSGSRRHRLDDGQQPARLTAQRSRSPARRGPNRLPKNDHAASRSGAVAVATMLQIESRVTKAIQISSAPRDLVGTTSDGVISVARPAGAAISSRRLKSVCTRAPEQRDRQDKMKQRDVG